MLDISDIYLSITISIIFSSVFFCLASNKAIAPFALSAFKQLIMFLSTIPFNNLVSIGSLHSIIN